MSYTYEHPRPSVTVDGVVLHYKHESIKILLIKRKSDPFKGSWALPGGFLEMDEAPEEGVKRELEEETGLKVEEVVQIGAFGKPERDPRGRVISISFLALINSSSSNEVKAASDAAEVKWFDIHQLPESLAFDHDEIIKETIKILKDKLKLSMVERNAFFSLKTEEIIEINQILKDK